MQPGDVLTVQQVAEVLQIGDKQVRRLCRIKRLQHVRIDGRGTLRVKRQWIDDYLQKASHQVTR